MGCALLCFRVCVAVGGRTLHWLCRHSVRTGTHAFICGNSKTDEQQRQSLPGPVEHWSWGCGAESQGQRATRTAIGRPISLRIGLPNGRARRSLPLVFGAAPPVTNVPQEHAECEVAVHVFLNFQK